MNNKRHWIRFLKILLTRVPVILFTGLAVISFITAWALDFKIAVLNVLPWGFLSLALGALGQIFLLSGEKIARQVKQELQKESDDFRQQSLDALHNRLTRDNDPRTEAALKDLREIARAIKDGAQEGAGLDAETTFDLLFKVEELFTKCVNRLEKSLKLWESAQEISNRQVKERLMKLRENVIEEVNSSNAYLGNIFARIQALNCSQSSGKGDLLIIMKDLEEGLEIAEQVDKKMKKLELGGRDIE
ncbi:MAG: hypothetical protein L6416_11695 [Candidatus Omnitrophica bacterium]|nr:hypothetical protein [Candidatus Omnitrophota bacterium]